ncbi:hypothetical protein [Evansella clarkii]|uniref:hypothetical protein n=1 Tax=Evansella clarkii TaxID=79879 RepID=UPI000998046C|nr:hypothetical protein [Evansella clarkii]
MNQEQNTKLDKLIAQTERRIAVAKVRVDTTKGHLARIKNKGGMVTEHGGWEKGYWESRLSVLEDTLDDLNELKMLGVQKIKTGA